MYPMFIPGGYRATETSDVSMWPSQLNMYIWPTTNKQYIKQFQ